MVFQWLVTVMFLWFSQVSLAATYHVSTFPELRDTLSSPHLTPGDIILVADGTYTISGQFALPVNVDAVTVRGASLNPDAVIIRGQGMTGGVSHVFFIAAHHVTIEYLTVQDVANHGIQTDVNIDGLHVNHCIFRDTYEQLFKVPKSASVQDPSENGVVENCIFEYTAGVAPNWYTGGIDVHYGKDWVIKNNLFRDIQSPGSHIAEHAVHFWSDSSGTRVEKNLIVNCDRGIGFGLGASPHTGGIIRNNMISHDGSGAFADVGIGIESSSDTQIYNNTVFMNHNRYSNAIEYRFSGTVNAYIANNLTNKQIVSRNSGRGLVEFNVTNARATWFVDVGSGDLHLAERVTQVANQGTAINGLVDDFDSQRRPARGGFDIGADEIGGAVVAMPVQLLLIPE